MIGHTPLSLSNHSGQSLLEVNEGRLVEYEQDVLDIKREIEQTWRGVLSVFFDKVDEKWVIVEHCKDGTDKIAFKTEALSRSTIDRIHRSDQLSRSFEDPNGAFERMDKEEEREKDSRLSEKIGEASERLYHALRRDGVIHRPQVHFTGKKAS